MSKKTKATVEPTVETRISPTLPDLEPLFPHYRTPEAEEQAEEAWSRFFEENQEKFAAMAASAHEKRRQGKTTPLESLLDEAPQ